MRSQRPGKGYRSGVQGPHYKEAGDKILANSKEAAVKDLLPELSGYHADTLITIKAEASSKADSRPN